MIKLFILILYLSQLGLILFLSSVSPKLRVHVIPHSHDDVGWLRTMDEYYSGSYCVRCILDNMVGALSENKLRTFVEVEMAFFEKWYRNQSEETKEKVKNFVKEGRLEFANGGWVMNDEACALSQDIIDQMRLGLFFLSKEFNYVPKVAWYLDPFGHSKTNAALMAKLGYENMVIVRIDYKEKNIRRKNKEMEFIWKPYNEIDNGKLKIFTHITYDHYSPRGRIWDNMFAGYTNIDYSSASQAYNYFTNQALVYRTNNLLFLYGDDFTFNNGLHPFKNMDKLISILNSEFNDKIEIFYSTPSKYFEEIKQVNSIWPELKDYDFYPYADDPKAYWTGYFSSRPYLKGFIRDVRQYFYHASLFFINSSGSVNFDHKVYYDILDGIKRTLSIAQHHDAVTGTARENVSEDYISMMENSISKFKKKISEILLGLSDNVKVCIPSVAEFECFEGLFDFISDHQTFIFIDYEKNLLPIHIRTNTKNFKVTDMNGNQVKHNKFCYIEEKECYTTLFLDFSENFYKIVKFIKSSNSSEFLEKKNSPVNQNLSIFIIVQIIIFNLVFRMDFYIKIILKKNPIINFPCLMEHFG